MRFSDGLCSIFAAAAFAFFATFFNRADQEMDAGGNEGADGNGGKDEEEVLHGAFPVLRQAVSAYAGMTFLKRCGRFALRFSDGLCALFFRLFAVGFVARAFGDFEVGAGFGADFFVDFGGDFGVFFQPDADVVFALPDFRAVVAVPRA